MNLPFLGLDGPDDASLPPGLGADLDRGLAVDPAVVARVRAVTTAEFRRRSTMTDGPLAAGPTRPAARGRWPSILRPVLSFGLAGALLLGSFGLVAANSGPGDPFYGLRLAAEGLNPLGGPSAHLDRLEVRLQEARQAAGNGAAVSAALRAYRDELQRALDEATDYATRQAILDTLDVHRVVLETLLQTAPAAATGGLQQALSQVGKADRDLRAKNPSSPFASPTPTKSTPDRTDRPDPSRRPSNR